MFLLLHQQKPKQINFHSYQNSQMLKRITAENNVYDDRKLSRSDFILVNVWTVYSLLELMFSLTFTCFVVSN